LARSWDVVQDATVALSDGLKDREVSAYLDTVLQESATLSVWQHTDAS
jgi:alpha-D-ribose 1-methylphosphonate 5-triphosphate synthase subunit PhnH